MVETLAAVIEFRDSESGEQVQNIAGTGLGMAITKSIMGLMEGTIELWSEQGKGSEFHVILDFGRAKERRRI